MAIRIENFGGPIVWFFRKNFSKYTSKIALEYAARMYNKVTANYIHNFNDSSDGPLFKIVNIETINRCNGKCAFCPANVWEEKRSLKKMDEALFRDIVDQLYELKWQGQMFLNVNNEPLLDGNIIDYSHYAKERLGESVILSMFTNGTMLTIEKLEELSESLDVLIINNYSKDYKLTEKNKQIYSHVKKNKERFSNINITIKRRYSEEILATRAGNAPNKKTKDNNVNTPCIYPFVDLTIFPDGKVGLCCNDCLEITDYGNVREQNLVAIWRGKKFEEVRRKMESGRQNYMFCKECDVVDSGIREKIISE